MANDDTLRALPGRQAVWECPWVFAYGSNMDLDDYEAWCQKRKQPPGQILDLRPARLDDTKLSWNYHSEARGGGAANITMARERSVYGLALRVSADALRAFDRKEGHPHRYTRGSKACRLRLFDGGELDAWVYQVLPEFCLDRFVAPTQSYLRLIIQAAERYGFP